MASMTSPSVTPQVSQSQIQILNKVLQGTSWPAPVTSASSPSTYSFLHPLPAPATLSAAAQTHQAHFAWSLSVSYSILPGCFLTLFSLLNSHHFPDNTYTHNSVRIFLIFLASLSASLDGTLYYYILLELFSHKEI